MASTKTPAKEGVEINPLKQRSLRFEKLLSSFSEKDQKLLINAREQEFKDFLKKAGFRDEGLFEDREAWISQGGSIQEQPRQDQQNLNKNKNENHEQNHNNHQDHLTERLIREAKIKELERKVEDGSVDEDGKKELDKLRQEQRAEDLEEKAKKGKITDAEKGELEKIKTDKATQTETKPETSGKQPLWGPGTDQSQPTNKPTVSSVTRTSVNRVKNFGKPTQPEGASPTSVWGESSEYSAPGDKPTITSARKNAVGRIKNFGKPTSIAGENASSLWGRGTGFSEPAPASTNPSPQSLGQGLPRLNLRPQTRVINGFNRGARVARNARRVAGALSKAAKASRAVSALASLITFLISNPVGWVIDIIMVCLIVVILFFILISGNNQGTAGEGSCDLSVCYYVDGPAQVANGGNIDVCYSITVIVDSSKQPNYSTLTLFDNYSSGSLDFVSASGDYAPIAPTGEVDWILGSNPSTSPTSLCPGSDLITPTEAIQKAFYFNLKLKTKTSADNSTVENTIGIR